MNLLKRLLITPGEATGIGPDITIQIAAEKWPVELVALADPDLLLERAKQLNLPLELFECDLTEAPLANEPGRLKVFPIRMKRDAHYVIHTLELATSFCLEKKSRRYSDGTRA